MDGSAVQQAIGSTLPISCFSPFPPSLEDLVIRYGGSLGILGEVVCAYVCVSQESGEGASRRRGRQPRKGSVARARLNEEWCWLVS